MGNLSKYTSITPPIVDPKEKQFADAMRAAGIENVPDYIQFDGNIHRFSTGKRDDKSGWYVAYDGIIPAGSFGDWKQNSTHIWRANIGRTFTHIEEMTYKASMAQAKAKRDAEFAAKRENSAEIARNILVAATPADASHPYLTKKGIQPHGALVHGDGRLVVPVCHDGLHDISSVQFISADGDKQFLTGGQISGCWSIIGDIAGANELFIAEGFATAASIHEATGKPCVIAFNAGNLPKVAKKVREVVGIACSITICADLDDSGVGQAAGDEAAKASGARLVVSPTKSDFNDAAQQGVDIKSFLMPIRQVENDWLTPLGEFCKKPAPIEWLIKRWLQRNSMCMVHGASGSGKTFVVIDWMCRIATTINDWCDYKVNNGVVVYLAGEGHDGLKGRFEAWSRKFYDGKTDKIRIYISKEGCNLNTPKGYAQARDAILMIGEQPVCIVVDTLHRFLEGDENSAQDAKGMLDSCAMLQKEFKSAVLLVHHTGVNEETQHRARGSSAWKGALDTEVSVKQNADKTIEIIQRKVKDAEMVEPEYMRLDPFHLEGWKDEDGDEYQSATLTSIPKPASASNKKKSAALKRFENALLSHGEVRENLAFISEENWKNSMQKDEKGNIPAKIRTQRSDDKNALVLENVIIPMDDGYGYNDEAILLIINNKAKKASKC